MNRTIWTAILEEVLRTNTEEEFFDKVFDGYSVTLDLNTRKLIYAKFNDEGKLEKYEEK